MMYKVRCLYSEVSSRLQAIRACTEKMERLNPNAVSASVEMKDNEYHRLDEWKHKHAETISLLCSTHLPHGSGFDSYCDRPDGWMDGTRLNLEASHADKLVFETSFHHMDENGFYDGWTEHTVTVTPSLQSSFHVRISGRNRNDIKEYIAEAFHSALSVDVTYDLLLPLLPEFAITSKWEDETGEPSQCYQAFYVNGKRFWNGYFEARQYASEQMEAKHYGKPTSKPDTSTLEALELAEATILRLERHAPNSANGTLDVVRGAIQSLKEKV